MATAMGRFRCSCDAFTTDNGSAAPCLQVHTELGAHQADAPARTPRPFLITASQNAA